MEIELKNFESEDAMNDSGYTDIETVTQKYGLNPADVSVLQQQIGKKHKSGFRYFPSAMKVMGSRGQKKWVFQEIEFKRYWEMRQDASGIRVGVNMREDQKAQLEELCQALGVASIPHLIRLVADGSLTVKWRRGLS